uniref:Transposase n=1 Tax=Acrobeloides nanus TaxID=290746 RepID=A0A914E189_9BILA
MKLPYTTVRNTIRRYRETGNYNDRPRSEQVETMENGHLIRSIYPHQSIEALKKSLIKAWNAIPQEVIDRAVDDFPKRLKKCIDAQGGHFESK